MIKIINKFFFILFISAVTAGCDAPKSATGGPKEPNSVGQQRDVREGFEPVKVQILPLTALAADGKGYKIDVYVSLLDSYDCSMKWPAVFRFELYEQVPRSVEPIGKRIKLWPDIDLKDPAKNNRYWQDFLRCYKFTLDVDTAVQQSYIFQSTVILPPEKRLTTQISLKSSAGKTILQ